MTKVMPLLALGLLTAACQKRSETTATETRPVTMRDENLNLDADNDERFGGSSPAVPPSAAEAPFIAGFTPPSWRELPGNSFRLLNYAFGEGGEVSVGLSRGGLLENVNRWLGQFGRPAIDAAAMKGFERIEVAGYEGVIFEAEGAYDPGMGRAAKDEQALIGIIAGKNGEILTVKMVGPKADVGGEMENLRTFAADLEASR